mgnify:CR=1 FL=1
MASNKDAIRLLISGWRLNRLISSSSLIRVCSISHRFLFQWADFNAHHFESHPFGTGYSSLLYLKRLHVTALKIDQSFVRDMLDDTDDLAILQGVIGLAAAFKRQVIAEGVETVAHGTVLLQLGCELAQGYGIARPMPADRVPDWVANWPSDTAWRPLTSVNIAG